MRVGIIGAGPSGTYCAIQLLRLAREQGRDIEVLLFDPKPFDMVGRKGCNLCAGMITSGVVERLRASGVEVDDEILQRPIRGFRLMASGGAEVFFAPRGRKLYSVFRGGGPLDPDLKPARSFDFLLVEAARNAGAAFFAEEAVSFERTNDPGGKGWMIGTGNGDKHRVDVLVGAFGVNSKTAPLFEKLDFGYRKPRTETAFQVEFRLEEAFIDRVYRNMVPLFNLGLKQARFAAIVPKRRHVTLTLVGDDPGWATVTWLLRRPEVRQFVPNALSARRCACTCKPVLPVRPARNAAGDGVVVIGDAHVSRFYKNGIGSAFSTSQYAAAAILKGTSRRSLRRHYVRRCRKRFYVDNMFGWFLFKLNDAVARSPFHSSVMLLCSSRVSKPGGKILNRAVWGLFTGELPYFYLFLKLFHPATVFELGLQYCGRILPGTRKRTSRLGPLKDGNTIAIIGGGLGGSCTALAAQREAERNGIEIRIILVEPKSFGTQYNQCLGVLTPPILEILAHEFGLKLDEGMIRRVVKGYRLWSEHESVELEEDEKEGKTVTLRRVELDKLFLNMAEDKGVRIVQSRVTGIEIHPEEVILFTDSGTFNADVIVGAFGLDDSMQKVFERHVDYVPPRPMDSIVIKLHPADPEMIERFQGVIQTFLVPVPGTAFAAIVPKRDHLSVVVTGNNVTTRQLLEFFGLPQVKRLLDFDYEVGQAFKGAFPNSPARNFYGDRYVMVGDATGLVRPFKGKGINSAVITGIRAGETMVNEGISREAFRKYARRSESLAGTIWCGKLVQFFSLTLGGTFGVGPMIRFAKKNEAFKNILHGAVSGIQDYKTVLFTTLRPSILIGLTRSYLRSLFH